MQLKPKRVLLFSPHTDDIELWCWGLISKLKKQGAEIFVCVFSDCKESVPEWFPKDALRKEFFKSMSVLWIPKENITFLDYKVRLFPQHRYEILCDIKRLWKQINPDLVLCHNTYDLHQDHQTVTNEVIRVFKKVSIFWYELS